MACCCMPAVASCRGGCLMGCNSALKSGRWGGMLLHTRSGFLPMRLLDGEQLSTEIRPLGWHAVARPQWLLADGVALMVATAMLMMAMAMVTMMVMLLMKMAMALMMIAML